MGSNVHSPLYSYFRPYNPPWSLPDKLKGSGKPASELDNHIGQLIQLRDSQYEHYRQRTSIYSLPFDILSLIFEKVVDPKPDLKHENFDLYQNCIRQTFVLCSVSLHFRQAALGTPELWKRLPLWVKQEKMEDNDALFRHSVPRALSSGLHISVRGSSQVLSANLDDSIMAIMFSSGAIPKIKVLDLSHPTPELPYWVGFLSSFPNLDTLIMYDELRWDKDGRVVGYDLRDLPLTRISIHGGQVDNFIFPSSVQILRMDLHLPSASLIRILYECPNLLECSFDCLSPLPFGNDQIPFFTKPLTLGYLEKLTWRMDSGLQAISSIQNLQMPSLEYLNLHSDDERYKGIPPAIILLCDHVSSTLTTLVLSIRTRLWTYDHLRQLVQLPLQKLETLEFSSTLSYQILSLIHALNPDRDKTEMVYLPTLRFLTLRYYPLVGHELLDDMRFAPLLLNVLQKRTVGERYVFDLTLDVDRGPEPVVDRWPAHWRRVLFSMVIDGKLRLSL